MNLRDTSQKESSFLPPIMFGCGSRALASDSRIVDRCFIPRKAPMIFRWHPNNAWNSRERITKRLNLRKTTNFWKDEDLLKKVREVAQPHIDSRRTGNSAAKHLQGEISYLFDENVRSEKEAHILAWMVVLYMHSELENNSTWSLPSLYTEEKMSSIFNFIYHLGHDLGSVFVMKGLAQRGHSPHLKWRRVSNITLNTPKPCGPMLEMQCTAT